MAKEKTPEQNIEQAGQKQPASSATGSGKRNVTGKKSGQSRIGGTAVHGAKSTLPRQAEASNNPQQQEIDSYNRTMRRRMQQLNAGPYSGENRKIKTPQERRKEKIERIKKKRADQVHAVNRTLPGGKIKTDTRRATRAILIIAAAVVLLIAVFVVLRVTGILN
jgi:hypothetical protein